jgi:DNA-binding response OmpR family regulator
MRIVLLSDDRIEMLLRGPLGDAGFQLSHVNTSAAVVAACQAPPAPFVIVASLTTASEAKGLLTAYRALLGAQVPPVIFILIQATEEEISSLQLAGAIGVYVTPVAGRKLMRQLKDLGAAAAAAPPPPPLPKDPTPQPPTPPQASSPLDSLVEQALLSRPPEGKDVTLSGLDEEEAEATPALIWPGELPEAHEAIALLVARTAGAPIAGSVPETLVIDTWRSLSHVESLALEALAGRGSREDAESPRTAALAGICATRLRLAAAAQNAERITAAATAVQVDEAGITALKQEIDRALKDVLDPTLKKAVEQGDVDSMRDFRTVREALTTRRQELDRTGDRLRGIASTHDGRTRLDEAEPDPEKAPKSGRFGTRLLQITTVTAEAARRNAPVLFISLGVIAALAIFLHLVVLDTFHLSGGPEKVEHTVSVVGVQRVEYFGTMARATVGDAFDRVVGLRELARAVPAGSTLVVVSEHGMILETLGPDRLQEMGSPPPPAPPPAP